ncbi:hypothetical protein D3C76_1381410 [compost metagenome]
MAETPAARLVDRHTHARSQADTYPARAPLAGRVQKPQSMAAESNVVIASLRYHRHWPVSAIDYQRRGQRAKQFHHYPTFRRPLFVRLPVYVF